MSTAWQPAGDYSDIRYELSPKEIWFLCRQCDARQALDMGLINAVVPLERLEEKTVRAADAQGELQRRRGRPGRIQ